MHQRRICLFILPALLLSSLLTGCAWLRNFAGMQPAPPPCVLAPGAAPEEVVGYLNENTAKITAWRTGRATVSSRGKLGVPISTSATIAVESPRNFRLIAYGPMGSQEADLGSNQDHFWFWNKNNEEKSVFRARHNEDPIRMRNFPIPFQPDWIMESLGVVAINLDEVTVQPSQPGTPTLLLIADRVSPQGFKVRKLTEVDTCHGVIRQHALYDARGQLIARAVLNGHRRFAPSQAVLPTRIDLDWPQAQLAMTLTLADIEVNPARIPPQTWTIPTISGYTLRDLGE